MSMIYDSYSYTIPCKEGDSVYIYKKNIFDKSNKINRNMIGTIISLEQCEQECGGWDDQYYLSYTISIKIKSGEIITITDERQKRFFRKYEFISLTDLEKLKLQVIRD